MECACLGTTDFSQKVQWRHYYNNFVQERLLELLASDARSHLQSRHERRAHPQNISSVKYNDGKLCLRNHADLVLGLITMNPDGSPLLVMDNPFERKVIMTLFTLAHPPCITKVVVMGDVELSVFLDAVWNRGFVVTSHVSTGASVWIFIGKVLVFSNLFAEHASWFQGATRSIPAKTSFASTTSMVRGASIQQSASQKLITHTIF